MTAASAKDFDLALATVKSSDSRRQLEALLPPVSDLFPGMKKELADFYMAELELCAIDEFTGNQATSWWKSREAVGLGPRGRRFICRVARLPVELADKEWLQITFVERARLIASFMWLVEWVNGTSHPVSRALPINFRDE